MRRTGIVDVGLNDLLALAGAGMAFWGLYLWWEPLAWMTGGAFLVWLGVAGKSTERD